MLWRSLRLRCPECGVSPLFPPLRRTRGTRGFQGWVTPLAGCPRCGYAYEREPGYFLPAIWIVHFFTVFLFGIGLWLLIDGLWKPSLPVLCACVLLPVLAFALLFVRHAKAFYLAFDHFVDPHVKPGGVGGVGGQNAAQGRVAESDGRSGGGGDVHFGNGRHRGRRG